MRGYIFEINFDVKNYSDKTHYKSSPIFYSDLEVELFFEKEGLTKKVALLLFFWWQKKD